MARFKTKYLEKVIRRAPLALRFFDSTRNEPVTDGLTTVAWRSGTTYPLYTAYRSLQSGIYGYTQLPGIRYFEPEEDTPPPQSPVRYVLYVHDNTERFLPQVLVYDLPKREVMPVQLFSSPARPPLSDFAMIFGQLKDITASDKTQAAKWAVINANYEESADTYTAVADDRGMFVLFIPYVGTFPSPTEDDNGNNGNLNGNNGTTGLNDLAWTLTFTVNYEPTKQNPIDTPKLPFTNIITPTAKSINEQQSAAEIRDTEGQSLVSEITRTLKFREPLKLVTATPSTTKERSVLWVQPAPPE